MAYRGSAFGLGLWLIAGGWLVASGPESAQTAVPASPSLYRILPSESTIRFSISKFRILRKEGRFRDFRGDVSIDWGNPAASRVAVTIAAASLDTSDRHRDETVRSDDFLDAARHPTLTFESRRIAPVGSGLYRVSGDLTIRGVTRPVTASLRVLPPADRAAAVLRFEGGFQIRRSDFGVNGERWSAGKAILGDDVAITLELAAASGGQQRASEAAR